MIPKCLKCGKVILAGQLVERQGGPHVLCEDPYITKHKRLMREDPTTPTGMQFGYVDDIGKAVWM